MKRLAMTIGLTCLLSMSTLAGDVHGVDSPAPAPSPTPQPMTSTDTTFVWVEPASYDALQQITDAALSAVLSVLSFV
jgi:hypothetical protein